MQAIESTVYLNGLPVKFVPNNSIKSEDKKTELSLNKRTSNLPIVAKKKMEACWLHQIAQSNAKQIPNAHKKTALRNNS